MRTPNCCPRPSVFSMAEWRGPCGTYFGVCCECSTIVVCSHRRQRYVPLSYRAMKRLMRTRPGVYRVLASDQRHIREFSIPVPSTRRQIKLLPLGLYLGWMARERAEVLE